MTQALPAIDLTCLPRYSTPRRLDRKTYGPRVAQVAENLGFPFMPWQRYAADIALEVDPYTGFLIYRECCLTVPRQSGKTVLLLAVMVHRAQAMITAHERKQRILYAAQTRIAARGKWEDEHLPILKASRYARDYTPRLAIGQEAIKWHNGSLHGITSNKETAGHGETLDLGVIDEAFAQEDSRLEQAFNPAMATRDQPQIWINSTAGTKKSVFLREKVTTGRAAALAGETEGSCYIEWSAPNEADPGDPETWAKCMPALGHTINLAGIRHSFKTLKLAEFRRAYLNQWQDEFPDEWLVIPEARWKRLVDLESVIVGPMVFAIDTTPERSWTSISSAGRTPEDLIHIETIKHGPGTAWAVSDMVKLAEIWGDRGWPIRVVIDGAGAAASLISEIETLADKRHVAIEIIKTTSQEYVQACGMFYDKVDQNLLRHLGEARLNISVAGAVKRDLEASWAWARKGLSVDISPLVGATLALWGFVTTDPGDDYDVLDSVR